MKPIIKIGKSTTRKYTIKKNIIKKHYLGYPIPAPLPPPAQALVTFKVAQMFFVMFHNNNISKQNTTEVGLHCDAFYDDLLALNECILNSKS